MKERVKEIKERKRKDKCVCEQGSEAVRGCARVRRDSERASECVSESVSEDVNESVSDPIRRERENRRTGEQEITTYRAIANAGALLSAGNRCRCGGRGGGGGGGGGGGRGSGG